ncbi:sulfite exporter TauE/SafE family protein [Pseudomonas nitroreducens]|uniref:sulfite exporter TauE/SafE family protein n=1 Tax=Pseudomonas nitroreducens TaxID=46680 RepID=UPI0023F90327|nr:sulfite exporter TauE/SafE family protein [Pseudomonas nitroreducens]WEW98961.1 sulfite exporter TauE/SafE family protein [Pseudomonas nitroreducens]
MFDALPQHLELIVLTFLLAGLVKGVVGLGLPTVAVGLLGLVMPPMQAAAILVVPSTVTNIWQLAAGPRFLGLLKRLWGMLLGIVVGTLAVGWLLAGENWPAATLLLGVALILYALLGLSNQRFSVAPQHERWLSPVIGLITGGVTAVTGVFVIPAVPFLQALGLEKDDLVQALGLSFTVSTLALAITLSQHGSLLQADVLGLSLLALLPALAGMYLGTWLRSRISPLAFRRCFFGGLLLLGADLAVRGI